MAAEFGSCQSQCAEVASLIYANLSVLPHNYDVLYTCSQNVMFLDLGFELMPASLGFFFYAHLIFHSMNCI